LMNAPATLFPFSVYLGSLGSMGSGTKMLSLHPKVNVSSDKMIELIYKYFLIGAIDFYS